MVPPGSFIFSIPKIINAKLSSVKPFTGESSRSDKLPIDFFCKICLAIEEKM
jgi:hypothetical protein